MYICFFTSIPSPLIHILSFCGLLSTEEPHLLFLSLSAHRDSDKLRDYIRNGALGEIFFIQVNSKSWPMLLLFACYPSQIIRVDFGFCIDSGYASFVVVVIIVRVGSNALEELRGPTHYNYTATILNIVGNNLRVTFQ